METDFALFSEEKYVKYFGSCYGYMESDISEGWSTCIQMDASKMHTGWVGGL